MLHLSLELEKFLSFAKLFLKLSDALLGRINVVTVNCWCVMSVERLMNLGSGVCVAGVEVTIGRCVLLILFHQTVGWKASAEESVWWLWWLASGRLETSTGDATVASEAGVCVRMCELCAVTVRGRSIC